MVKRSKDIIWFCYMYSVKEVFPYKKNIFFFTIYYGLYGFFLNAYHFIDI